MEKTNNKMAHKYKLYGICPNNLRNAEPLKKKLFRIVPDNGSN